MRIADLKADSNEGGGNYCGPPSPLLRQGYAVLRRVYAVLRQAGEKQEGGRVREPGNRNPERGMDGERQRDGNASE